MKCRLCELSVSTTPKLGLGVNGGGTACNHVAGDSPMTMSPSIGQFYHFAGFVPQLRDMMLAACLFRGGFFTHMFIFYYAHSLHEAITVFNINKLKYILFLLKQISFTSRSFLFLHHFLTNTYFFKWHFAGLFIVVLKSITNITNHPHVL